LVAAKFHSSQRFAKIPSLLEQHQKHGRKDNSRSLLPLSSQLYEPNIIGSGILTWTE
jgi:hypothetical protein